MAGITYRKPTRVCGFSKRIAYNTSGFATSIFVGTIPLGGVPLSIRIIRLTEFTVGAYFTLGFSAGGTEWTGYVYLADSGSKPSESTNLVVSGTVPKIIECLEWKSLTVPTGAARNIYFQGGTIGSPISAGDCIVQVTFLD